MEKKIQMTVHRSVNDSASNVSRRIMTSCINVIDPRASQQSAASQSSICVQAVAPQDPLRG
ncbi:MAG TPA: hypothetical protein VJJ98_15270 [Sedimentisphaerales bacterium]|nr:hypothetical protein [Sedimentisphaerales bacterium]